MLHFALISVSIINLLLYRAEQSLVVHEQNSRSFADRVMNVVHNKRGFDDLFTLRCGMETYFLFRFRGDVRG